MRLVIKHRMWKCLAKFLAYSRCSLVRNMVKSQGGMLGSEYIECYRTMFCPDRWQVMAPMCSLCFFSSPHHYPLYSSSTFSGVFLYSGSLPLHFYHPLSLPPSESYGHSTPQPQKSFLLKWLPSFVLKGIYLFIGCCTTYENVPLVSLEFLDWSHTYVPYTWFPFSSLFPFPPSLYSFPQSYINISSFACKSCQLFLAFSPLGLICIYGWCSMNVYYK